MSSDSTINFGLDVTTGDSVQEIDKLTGSVEGLIERYTELMMAMGRGDEVIAKVSKAMGMRKGELDMAAQEIQKVQKALRGDANTKAFGNVSKDLKDALAGIPIELKAVTQQVTAMTELMNNKLGGLVVTVEDLKEELKKVGAMPAEPKPPKEPKPVKKDYSVQEQDGRFLDAAILKEKEARKEAEETGKAILRKKEAQDKYNETVANAAKALIEKNNWERFQKDGREHDSRVMTVMKNRAYDNEWDKAVMAETEAKEKAAAHGQQIKENIALKRKEREEAEALKRAEEDRVNNNQTRAAYYEHLENQKKKIVEVQKAEEEAYKEKEKRLVAVQRAEEAAYKEKEKLDNKEAKDDRRSRFNRQAAVKIRTEPEAMAYINEIKKTTAIVAAAMTNAEKKGFIDSDKAKKAQHDITLISRAIAQLREANIDMEGDAGRALIALSTKLGDLTKRLANLRRDTTKQYMIEIGLKLPDLNSVSKRIKELTSNVGSSVIKNASLESLIATHKELIELKKDASTIKSPENVAAANVMLSILGKEIKLRNELAVQKKKSEEQTNSVVAAMKKEQIQTQSWEKSLQHTSGVDLLRDKLIKANAIAMSASGGPSFLANLEEVHNYKNDIDALTEAFVKLHKAEKDSAIKEVYAENIKTLKELKEGTNRLARGLDVTGMTGIKNPEAIKTAEEIALLHELDAVTQQVIASRERLNNSKGNKTNTQQARQEYEALKLQQEEVKAKAEELKKIFIAQGMSGSQAAQNINNAYGKLTNSMASLKGTISATESSFKNMWGHISMTLGKMMLWYHSISVGVSLIKNSFTGIVSMFDSIMKGGESITSIQKTLNVLNNGDIKETRRDYERLRQIVYAYGQDLDAISASYVKWAGITKESGADAESMWRVYEKIIASSRGLGIKQAEMGDYMKAFEQILSKGRVGAEEFNQQLAEKVTNLYGGIKKALADIRGVQVKTIDLQAEMKKGTFKVSEFLSAFDQYSNKWAAAGNTLADAYSAAVGRLNMAWKEFLVSLSEGAVGSKIRGMIEDLTVRLKDPDTVSAMSGVVTSLTEVSQILYNLATIIIPKIGAAIRKIPFVGYDEAVANKKENELLKAGVAQVYVKDPSYFNTAFENKAQRAEESNPLVSKFFQMKQATGLQSIDVTAAARKVNAMDDSMVDKVVTDIAELNLLPLVEKGFLQVGEDGTFIPADSAKSAAEHMAKITQSNIQDLIIMPYLKTLENFGGIDAVNAFKTKIMASAEAAELQFSGEAAKLAMESNTPSNAKEIMRDLGIGTNMLQGDKVLKLNPNMFTKLDSTTKTGDTDAKIKSFKKSLENIQDQINKASMGKWAYEFSQVTHKVKELEIELGDKATPQIAALGTALRKEFLENFAKGLEEFDNSLDMKARSGKYGKEMQTTYDSILKDYRDNKEKLDKEFKGMSLSSGATEEQMRTIEEFNNKILDARKNQFEGALEEAVVTEKTITKAKIQGAEKTFEALKDGRNRESKDVITNMKSLINDSDRLSAESTARRIADIERAGEVAIREGAEEIATRKQVARMSQAETDKMIDAQISNYDNFADYLNNRFAKEQGLFDNPTTATTKQFEKMYDAVGSGMSEMGETLQRAFTDSFTGVLDSWDSVWKEIQASFLKGLAAMMWEAKAKPIQIGIVSALTGVTPAIAGGLPTTPTNIPSGVGGTPGAASGGMSYYMGASGVPFPVADPVGPVINPADAAKQEGMFSKLSEGINDMTKAVNDFGKDVLGMTTDLTDAIVGAGVGVGIAQVMFPESQLAKVGGAIGGAAGQIIGSTFGSMGGPIGSVIGSVAGAAIGKFLTSEKKVTDYGIRVSVDTDGLKFLDKYERVKKSGSLNLAGIAAMGASMGTMMGTTWNHGSTRDRYTAVDPQVYKQISSAITASFSTISRQMMSLGMSPNFSGFSINEKVSLKGGDPEALLQAWLNKLSGKMVDTALGNASVLAQFTATKKMGETSSDALKRLVEAMTALEDGAIKANVSIEALAGGLSGLDLASYASDLSDALGGSSGVSAFFGRIEKFVGYVGTEGIQNVGLIENKFQTALENINGFAGQSGTRSSILEGQRGNLELSKADLENKIGKFAAGGGWRQWVKFDGENLTTTGKGGYNSVEEMAAANPKWKTALEPIIAYVAELKNVNTALDSVATKLAREENLPQATGIKANSATFWGDYQKALSQPGGLTPELTAAWDAAAQVAETMADVRESAIKAREELEKQSVAYNEQRNTLALSATLFNTSAAGLQNISRQAEAMNQNDLPTWFKESGDTLMEGLVPGLKALTRAGETTLDALVRLTNNLKDIEQAASLAGTSVSSLSGGKTGIEAANYAQGLVDYFGSTDIVKNMFSNISKAAYTDDQSKEIALKYWRGQAEAQAAALGTDMAGAKEWMKEQLTKPLSPEQISRINDLATSLNTMEDIAGTSADAVSDLADYLQELKDKIATLGMSDTEEFLFNLDKETKGYKKEILAKGGTENDTLIADMYQAAAISQRLSDMMDETNKSIRKLTTSDLKEQINTLSDSYWEQAKSAALLGATQEELNAILYNSYLQAKQVLASAANAYVQAYDSTVSKIEELKNKQKGLEDDLDSARNNYMASLKKEIDLKQEAIDKLQENVDGLKDFISNLKDLKDELLTSGEFLSPSEAAGATMSQFMKTATLAAGGDKDARGRVSDQAKSALEASKNGSYEDYIRSFAQIYGTVNDLQNKAETELSPQEKQLNELIASRDILQGIYDTLQKEADKTLSVTDAEKKYKDAQTTLANSTYQAQIDVLQAQVDAHRDVVEKLRKDYDTTMSLGDAATQYNDIKDMIAKVVPDPTRIVADSAAIGRLNEIAPNQASMLTLIEKMDTSATESKDIQNAMALDITAMKSTQNNMNRLLTQIEDYLYPESTSDGTDVGIKTLVAAASVRDGVLLALRSANDLETTDDTSVIGLLKGIKTCACAAPASTCLYYADEVDCDGVTLTVNPIPDTSGLSDMMTDKAFLTIGAAIVYSRDKRSVPVTQLNFPLGNEDPDCVDTTYFIEPVLP